MASWPGFLPLFRFIPGVALLFAIFWFYWPVLANLVEMLLYNEDFSFGLLLPFVAAYITYLKWPQIRRLPWQPSWFGIIIICGGFILYAVGELAASLYIPCFSFVVVLAGLLFLLGGWGLVRLLSFPLLLLILTIPLQTFFIKKLTLPLQLISSQLAAMCLNFMGIPVFRQGNVLDLGVRQLQVVQACSGLRYILALMALGVIFCYFYQRRTWKGALLLVSLIPSAILANALRVAAMGIFPSLQEGFLHSFSGWLIFIFCFGFLALLNWGLNALRPPTQATETGEKSSEDRIPAATSQKSHTLYLLAALAVVLITGPLVLRVAQSPLMPLRQSLDNFPQQLGSWEGKRDFLDPATAEVLKADDYLDIKYQNPDQGSVSLWIAYYQNQRRTVAFHSPYTCLTGGGWKVLESGDADIGQGLPVNYLLLEQGESRILVYYWYMMRGRWLTSEYLSKLYIGYDGLVKRRTDGALVRLITPVGNDVNAARQRLTSFAQLVRPQLPRYIPD